MGATEDEGHKIQPSEDGYISSEDAERFMVIAQAISSKWVDHYANAIYYKEEIRWRRDSAYNLAFISSGAKSDRQRDIDAKQDPTVRMAESKLIEALAALKLAELRHDELVRAYHAFKKIIEVREKEKQYL
jgi:hypothetical protein